MDHDRLFKELLSTFFVEFVELFFPEMATYLDARSVTAVMALKLGAAFRTSPDFWMNAQRAADLYEAAGHVSNLPKPLLKAS